jgi:hypothetical protein
MMGGILPLPVFFMIIVGILAFTLAAYSAAGRRKKGKDVFLHWLKGAGFFALGAFALFGILYFMGSMGHASIMVLAVFFIGLFANEFLPVRGFAFVLISIPIACAIMMAVFIGGIGAALVPMLVAVPLVTVIQVLRTGVSDRAFRRLRVWKRRRRRRIKPGKKTKRLLGRDRSSAAHWDRRRGLELGRYFKAHGVMYRIP